MCKKREAGAFALQGRQAQRGVQGSCRQHAAVCLPRDTRVMCLSCLKISTFWAFFLFSKRKDVILKTLVKTHDAQGFTVKQGLNDRS